MTKNMKVRVRWPKNSDYLVPRCFFVRRNSSTVYLYISLIKMKLKSDLKQCDYCSKIVCNRKTLCITKDNLVIRFLSLFPHVYCGIGAARGETLDTRVLGYKGTWILCWIQVCGNSSGQRNFGFTCYDCLDFSTFSKLAWASKLFGSFLHDRL